MKNALRRIGPAEGVLKMNTYRAAIQGLASERCVPRVRRTRSFGPPGAETGMTGRTPQTIVWGVAVRSLPTVRAAG